MKLLTHNMLASHVKGINNRYPLGIKVTKINTEENEYNEEFVKKMLKRMDYAALLSGATQVGYTALPPQIPDNSEENEEFLKAVHHAILNIVIVEGELICPESGRVFPIRDGIPNMLLTEDEV